MVTEILENKRNIEHLSEAQAKGRMSHAYIINGSEGSGKKTLASYIAASLLCNGMGEAETDGQADIFAMFGAPKPAARTLKDGPCGSCPACTKSLSGNHPDIICLRREKEKVIRVEEVRQQIIDDISIKPFYGPYKIYIIEDAQLMNESAQNALLKTIEEPPEYAVIFLLTENADIFLDTIRSRCIRLDMESLSPGTIRRYLKDRLNTDDADADRFAAFARGNLGRAIELAEDEDSAQTVQTITDTLKKLKNMNAADIFDSAAALGKSSPEEVLEISRMWFRDALIMKADQGSSVKDIYFPAEEAWMKELSAGISYGSFNGIMEAIDTAQARLDANVKAEAVLEAMFLTIRRNCRNKGSN